MPETRKVMKMRGKGSTSVLCVRNTSAKEIRGEAQKTMLPTQHSKPTLVLTVSDASPETMKRNESLTGSQPQCYNNGVCIAHKLLTTTG